VTTLDITDQLGPAVSIMGNTVSGLVNRAAATLDQTLDPHSTSKEVRNAASAWASAHRTLDELPDVLASFTQQLARLDARSDLTTEARTERANTILDGTLIAVNALTAAVQTQLARIDAYLTPGAQPAKPGNDAATEARIAGAKADVVMLLTNAPADARTLAVRLADRLTRAIRTGDDVTAWLLGTSTWPVDFVQSRCPDDEPDRVDTVVTGTLATALDAATGTSYAEVRQIKRVVDSSDGAVRLTVALGQLPGIVRDAASSRVYGWANP
jgi:hypothetical protein